MTVKQKIENKLLICFADDMFPELDTSSFASCKSNTVLASRLDINSNERRGIIVAKTIENNLYIDHIVEKPSKELLQELIVRFGVENLYCLEGRFILDKEFLNSINISQCMVGKEPKLSMAINNYAKNNLVNIFVYSGECLDLGSL